MTRFSTILLVFIALGFTSYAQPANDNCANATNLTVNAACVAGTTAAGGTQAGEVTAPSCAGGTFNQTVWYKFTATATHMYVQLVLTTFSGSGATWGPGYWTSVVYKTNSCLPTAGSIVSCQTCNSQGNADGVIANEIFGMTIGATYYIQVGYKTGMGVNLIPNYCINVSDQFTPDCNTCANPCGPACGFTTQPTAAQVTANCPSYPQMQYNEGAVTDTQCYTFNAVNDTADFQVIVNSTCGTGNVSNFTWNLYHYGNCGAGAIQSGNLSSLRFTNLTIGAGYVFCFTFTVPSGCYHTAYWPYFIGATPLPVELLTFTGEKDRDDVILRWSTASELNNDYFLLEHSPDMENFSPVAKVSGAGNATVTNNYTWTDSHPFSGVNYYRLRQLDFDGHETMYPVIALRFEKNSTSVFPNPVNELTQLSYRSESDKLIELKVFDMKGVLVYSSIKDVLKGDNNLNIDLHSLATGIYSLQIIDGGYVEHLRFTKN